MKWDYMLEPDDGDEYQNMLEKIQEWTPDQVRKYCSGSPSFEKLWEELIENIAVAEIGGIE